MSWQNFAIYIVAPTSLIYFLYYFINGKRHNNITYLSTVLDRSLTCIFSIKQISLPMKYSYFLGLLFIGISIQAQQITALDNLKVGPDAGVLSNPFILPTNTNTILDAEHYFSDTEIIQLDKLIDSINIARKLKLQFAFITLDYFAHDSLKFDQFVDSLTSKWNPGKNISRILLVVCMQLQTAALKLSGNKFIFKDERVLNAKEDNGELTDKEKGYQANFVALTNGVLQQSNLGNNLSSKHFMQAISEYIQTMVSKQDLFFELD